MADNDDEFDEWLDDVDISDSDLDQGNIDELLNAGGTMASNTPAPRADAKKGSAELDQDNIDALLGLSSTNSSSKDTSDDSGLGDLDQDNIDNLLSGTGYDATAVDDFSLDELDQDNIDALLAASDDDDELTELAQDNIDALLAGSGQSMTPAAASQEELDQDDIDSLFASKPEDTPLEKGADLDELFASKDAPTAAGEDQDDLVQGNIDALFDDLNAPSAPAPEATAQKEDNSLDELFTDDEQEEIADVLTPTDADQVAASAFDSELDEMDQLFAEIESDVEDDDPFQAEEIDFAEMLGKSDGDDQEFIELDTETQGTSTAADNFMTQAGAEDDDDIEAIPLETKGLMIPAALLNINRSVLAGLGGGVVLLLLVGLYFLFSGPQEDMETHKEASAPIQQTPPAKMVENFIPVTENALYDMGSQGGEVAITLTALDKDDQPLIYDITSQPLHGRLSGTAPQLTYLPDNTFPGQDRFEFTVSDGTDKSTPAVVTINGPDLATLALAQKAAAKEATAEKKIFKPLKPKVLAKDVTYFTISTGAVTIDWAHLWQEANTSAFVPQEVHVEIVDTAMKGALEKRDQTSHVFTPDPFLATTDTIHYRFKKGGFRSATKTVSINVEVGSPAPEINIAKLADGYLVGQNIIIDASASRDEARESLQFFWEQVSGVNIDLQLLNTEGSKIAFTMPSSFYSEPDPGPTLAVTAIDNTGKEIRKEIKVKMLSRRQTALWRGENGHVSPDPPMQGRYFPWPFDD
ncbi:MAG: hypothetical protein KKD73_09545 [Proteobacteria bacterium]|nr:hypothetical protein [Pseudomonadota bacterium]MBU1639414.1 hypothetical protein [Pseudomonadota bacterium]